MITLCLYTWLCGFNFPRHSEWGLVPPCRYPERLILFKAWNPDFLTPGLFLSWLHGDCLSGIYKMRIIMP